MIRDADSAGEEKDLWRRFRKTRDQRARDELVAMYLPVACRMASRYARANEPADDLIQVASLGLVNAVDRFDPDRGTPFLGFAKPTILGELKRYFRDKAWTIRVPRAIHDRIGEVDAATEELTDRLGRPPLASEVAAHLGADVDEVLEALQARHDRRPLALDAPVGEEEDRSAPEWLGSADVNFELVEERATLARILPSLGERELKILRLRFVDDLPQSEIAARVGYSQMHVSRLLRAALARLREEAEGQGADGSEDDGSSGPTLDPDGATRG